MGQAVAIYWWRLLIGNFVVMPNAWRSTSWRRHLLVAPIDWKHITRAPNYSVRFPLVAIYWWRLLIGNVSGSVLGFLAAQVAIYWWRLLIGNWWGRSCQRAGSDQSPSTGGAY